MGYRNACISRHGNGRRHTGYKLKVNPRSRHRFRLFSTASENKWVPPFEPHHYIPRFGLFNEQSIDIGLGLILAAPPTTDIDTPCCGRSIL